MNLICSLDVYLYGTKDKTHPVNGSNWRGAINCWSIRATRCLVGAENLSGAHSYKWPPRAVALYHNSLVRAQWKAQ